MNKQDILSLLKPLIKDVKISSEFEIKNVDFKWQSDNESTILCLKATDSLKEIIKNKIIKSLVVTTNDLSLDNQIIIDEKNWLEAQKIICDSFFPIPKDLKLVGITGTNGKTSTAFFLTNLLTQNEIKSASIGTLGLVDGQNQKVIKDFSLTTPSYIDIRKIISGYYGRYEIYVFEVSSHALSQERFYELRFDVAGWTSFSQDHLDYHKTMDEYFNAKMMIFKKLKKESILVISENEKHLIDKIKKFGVPYKSFCYKKEYTNSIFKAEYNRSNFDVAVGIAKELVSNPKISEAKIKSPPGRFEVIESHGYEVVVDFAHTPDALENILKALKKTTSKKIVTVFGCGGDRDPSKRPIMGRIAQESSDIVIVTSDNPRFEEPEKIIEDIKIGLKTSPNVHFIISRKEAIKFALECFKNDLILIAGKGHEAYLDIKGVKHPYSDLEEVKRWICD